jgi:hypothetical protein
MKKTLRTVVATLLILVMLFSVSVTTIFAADSNTAGGTGSVAPIPPSSDTGSGDSINLGNWIKIGYDDDSIDIVWYHMIGAMLETISKSPEQLEQLSEMLTEAIEHLVIDPLEEGMIGGGNSGDVVLDDVTDIDALWDAALTTYLSKHSAEYGTDKTEATVAFFKKVMNEDISAANSAAKDFTEYVCGLISVGVRASKDPDSRIKPGTSLLVAIQTEASSSQVKSIRQLILHSPLSAVS